jgi:A/G-specific adenine glycosylase
MLSAKSVQRAVVAWFEKAKRDLPWRGIDDAYAILVSELMLQQTQVATVIPYFERWLARFPDAAALAAASEQDVLSLWQGLGYYSRARNLHRAAKAVVDLHGGKIPADAAAIRALPGVGRYTAGAVASFAFDLPEPLVDANVARVIARLIDLREPIDTTRGQAALWKEATRLVPEKGAGLFNAAIMELGALVCTARNPGCLECPIRKHCLGFAAGTAQNLPVKKPRKKRVDLVEHCGWTVRDNELLLEYQQGPRWKGLWKLPNLPEPPKSPPVFASEYPFTHHRVFLRVYRAAAPAAPAKNQSWHAFSVLNELPLTAPHRRAVGELIRKTPERGT